MNYTTEQQITAIEVASYLLEKKLAELKSESTQQMSLNNVADMLEASKKSEEQLQRAYEEKIVPMELRMSLDMVKDILMNIL